jgi:TolB-like protein/Flp pilus assembly protein TadD
MNEPTPPLLSSTWAELKRRKVVRAGIAYAIVAWLVLQVAEIVYQPLGLPAWAMTWTVLGAVLGFPVALVLAWYFDATRRGLARDDAAPARRGAARLFGVGVVLLTVVGVAWWLAQMYRPGDGTASVASPSNAPPNSIAVLPFDDMSASRDQAWFADGIAEELLDRLARVPGLQVAARTSSFAFREREADIMQIGRRLNVAHVLEGSVRKADGRVRVTAQLIDADDGFHLWSETYERPDQDIFALQDEITGAIADELRERIQGVGPVAAGGPATADVRAHELYLEGRQYWRERTPASLQRAAELFRQATERDPKFARAWAGLADTYLLQEDYGVLPVEEAVAKAEPAAVQAVTLDPASGEAWASLGLLRICAGQLQAAKGNLLQAMKLDPRYEMAPMWLAGIYGREGRFAERRDVLMRAHELSPLEPVINSNLADAQMSLGDVAAARKTLSDALATLPGNDLLLRTLAGIELRTGDVVGAVRHARRALEVEPDAPSNLGVMFEVLTVIEDHAGAAALIERMAPASRQRLLVRQRLALIRGEDVLVPELVEHVAPLMASGRTPNPAEREELSALGLAHLSAGRDAEAALLLERAVGTPQRLAEDLELTDQASLLLVALRRMGRQAEAEPWSQAVRRNGAAFAHLTNNAFVEYVRALYALEEGRHQDAIAALQRAYTAGFRARWQLDRDPRLMPIRDDPAVRALHARIGTDLSQARAESARAG